MPEGGPRSRRKSAPRLGSHGSPAVRRAFGAAGAPARLRSLPAKAFRSGGRSGRSRGRLDAGDLVPAGEASPGTSQRVLLRAIELAQAREDRGEAEEDRRHFDELPLGAGPEGVGDRQNPNSVRIYEAGNKKLLRRRAFRRDWNSSKRAGSAPRILWRRHTHCDRWRSSTVSSRGYRDHRETVAEIQFRDQRAER